MFNSSLPCRARTTPPPPLNHKLKCTSGCGKVHLNGFPSWWLQKGTSGCGKVHLVVVRPFLLAVCAGLAGRAGLAGCAGPAGRAGLAGCAGPAVLLGVSCKAANVFLSRKSPNVTCFGIGLVARPALALHHLFSVSVLVAVSICGPSSTSQKPLSRP